MSAQRPTREPGSKGWLHTWQGLIAAILGLVAAVLGIAVPLLETDANPTPTFQPTTTSGQNVHSGQPSAPATTEAPAEPPGTVPARFIGKWEGAIDQEGTPQSPYPVRMTLSQGSLGEEVGSVEYPTLECSGRHLLNSSSAEKLVVTEKIRTGKDKCLDGVLITLKFRSDNTIDYSFSTKDILSGTSNGSGVLRKKP